MGKRLTKMPPWERPALFALCEFNADLIQFWGDIYPDLDAIDYHIISVAVTISIAPHALDPKVRKAFEREATLSETTLVPWTVADMARHTRLPHETVRRRIKALTASGWIRPRNGRQYIVSPGGLANPQLARNLIAQHEVILRYLSRLEELGVKIPESI